MNIDKLREELKIDEGYKEYIYLDHLELRTFGVGHLVTRSDPEWEYGVGEPISEERCIDAFEEDVQIVLNDCKNVYPFFDDLPEEAQLIVANMMFNMGSTRMRKFLKFKVALSTHNWKEAAIEMEDSRWHKQVTNRANRLIERMKNISISWGNPTVDME
jgi:GH24 family phage-related lysozyme (muramidase)